MFVEREKRCIVSFSSAIVVVVTTVLSHPGVRGSLGGRRDLLFLPRLVVGGGRESKSLPDGPDL